MFHRPPRPEDNVYNIICGKGIKVLLKNKVSGASFTEAAWSPRVFFIFWLNSHLGRGGSPMSTYLPWLLRPTQRGAQGGAPSTIQTGASGLT